MSQIVLVGVNHKTAPVEIREQLAVVCRQDTHLLHWFPQLRHVEELFVLSTCNRVEILFVCSQLNEAIHEVKSLFKRLIGDDISSQLEPCFYTYQFLDAVKHLFRVASSLDSMVVGEPQILGQIKAAYRDATECKAVGVVLNRLLHKAFSVAKRVRSETMIGSHAVSISYAAVELARKIFRELRDKRVLLIGAGEMAELAAEHLLAQGVRQLTVANRTLERAVELAGRFKAETIPFSHILDALKHVDIVLTSTGSQEPILRYQSVKARMRERRNRPLFFIDIAVPRDVEQKVNEIENVYLYDIDDLQGVVDLNRAGRETEAEKAEHIVAEETVKFQQWLCTLDVVPTIVQLREKADTIRRQELLRTLSHLPHLSERDQKAIDILTQSIVKKLLHDPIVFLKKKARRGNKQLFTDCTQQLFNLTNGRKNDSPALTDEVLSGKNDNNLLKNLEK